MAKSKKLKSSELLLLLLYADECTVIRGNTRFQKLIFIFEKELLKQYSFDKLGDSPNLFSFGFEAYKFGPYSKFFYNHMDFFISFGMIYKEETSIDNDFYLENTYVEDNDLNENDGMKNIQYILSQRGKEYVQNFLWNQLNQQQKEVLCSLKQQFAKMPLKDILYYVYSKHPEMTTKSEILEKIIKKEDQNESKYD